MDPKTQSRPSSESQIGEATTRGIRESYDHIAGDYAQRIADELRHKPLDRQLLDRFAAQVAGRGDVCDIGCGPGHVARYLRDAGVAALFGLDLSPGMIQEAQRLNPDIRFREGNMLALDIPDATLAGIAAFYAIVNMPKTSLPVVFGEMSRVLQPGGLLLLAFHVGDEAIRERECWGHAISMEFFLLQPADIRRQLETAGTCVRGGHRARAVRARSGIPKPPRLHLCPQAASLISFAL
jgi:SAM-dependent methyltransferase